MDSFGPPEIMRILAVTDALGLHREAMRIPLWTKGKGEILVKGNRLEISGLNNSYLWDRKDLRTMELVRVNCTDGIQGPGEGGIDCGLRCPTSCPMP